jgi:GAF domain-containing protein
MTVAGENLLHVVARAAVEATGAARGAIVMREDGELRVVGVAGEGAGRSVGEIVPPDSQTVGFVLSSGQSLSLGPREDPSSSGVERAVLCVPCMSEHGVVGALELVGPPGGEPFPLDATGLAMLFGQVAGVALVQAGGGGSDVPSPAELGAELNRLAAADPERYATVSSVVSALLSHG